MQRIVLKVIAGLIAVGVILIGLLAVALPRLINSDESRSLLRASAADALGTPVEWQSLEVGLLPPRLTIRAPVLVAAIGNPEDARLTAESVDLRLALLPIFAGRIQVDSLVLRGVQLVVTRTPEGFLLPIAQEEYGLGAMNPEEPAVVDEALEQTAFDLGFRRIVISESRIILHDRTLPRPIEWRFEDLEFEAKSGSAGELLAIEFAASLRSGTTEVGRIQTAGTVSLTGLYDLDIEVEKLLLAEIQPYISDVPVGGMLSGRVSLNGAASTLSEIDLDLHIDRWAVRTSGLDLAGGMTLQASQTLDESAEFSAILDLGTGGRTEITGTLTLEGVIDAELKLDALELAPFAKLLDPEMELAGLATGKARIVGEVALPEFISLDVGVESGLLRMPDYFVEGPFFAILEVKDPFSGRPRGQIDLDLTAARLEYRDQFKKPAGMRAKMTTKFVSEESGEIVFESRIEFRNIDETIFRGVIGDSTSVALTTSSFNLEGWSDVLPTLEPYQLDGLVTFEGISVELVDDSPSQFGGRIEFKGVGLDEPNAGRLRIQGAIVGEGRHIRAKGLRVLMGGMTIGIDGKVEDPLNEARFELAVQSIGVAEVNDLLSALTSTRDTLFGDLQFIGELEGVASSETDLYSSLEGKFKFSIGKEKGGRLRGVSILQTILDQIPLLGGAVGLTQAFRAHSSVDDYFSERFEIIEGDFEIGQGRVDAKTLRLVYEGYEAELSGPVRLRDLSIDMTGEVLLKEDLVSALGGFAGVNPADRNPIRIPLARVTNTLAEPKIVMTKDTLAALPKLFFQTAGLETLAIDLGRALGQLLGGDEK